MAKALGQKCMLTTFDNPYDPYTEFPKWLIYDTMNGYNSCGYLARLARTSEEFTDAENAREIEWAIDEIIKYDFRGVYRKVKAPGEAKKHAPEEI